MKKEFGRGSKLFGIRTLISNLFIAMIYLHRIGCIKQGNIFVVQPFLKWAGGKRWLVQNHSGIFPKSYNRYIEPFLGSGAVFFHLQPKEAVLSDANGRLIETYQAIKDNPKIVQRHLLEHQKNHSSSYYYEIRAKNFSSPNTRAAQFIYLNRTCYNGLYRENLKGIFNVPLGTNTNVVLSTDNFCETSLSLKNTKLVHSDFESIIDTGSAGDFIFVDPPYTVAHNKNGFISYNQKIFSWEDQVRLREAIFRANERGCIVLVTNAAHASIGELYENDGQILELERRTRISATQKGRSLTSEYLITIGEHT